MVKEVGPTSEEYGRGENKISIRAQRESKRDRDQRMWEKLVIKNHIGRWTTS